MNWEIGKHYEVFGERMMLVSVRNAPNAPWVGEFDREAAKEKQR